MKVPAEETCVVGSFGENVRHKIRRPSVGVVIELRTNRAELGRKSDIVADKLIGVLNTHPDRPMLVDMVSDAKFSRPRVRHSNAEVLILVVRDGQIGGDRADAIAVRRQPAPCLAPQKLPVAALDVPKVKPQPVRKAIYALIHAGSAIPAEIAFHVTHDVTTSIIVFDLHVEAGELRRGAQFSGTSLSSVAERYAGEIGRDVTLRVRGSKYILEIDESSEVQNCVTEFDGPDRSLLSALLRRLIGRLARGAGIAVVDLRRTL